MPEERRAMLVMADRYGTAAARLEQGNRFVHTSNSFGV